MKKSLLIAGILFGLCLLWGHAPSDMEFNYETEEQILTVEISHNVRDPESHYVFEVTISNDDQRLVVQQLSRQDDRESVTLRYRIPDAEPGMLLTVVANCNRFGSLTKEYELE